MIIDGLAKSQKRLHRHTELDPASFYYQIVLDSGPGFQGVRPPRNDGNRAFCEVVIF